MQNVKVEIEDKKVTVLEFDAYNPNNFVTYHYKVIVGWVNEGDPQERIVVEESEQSGFSTIIDRPLHHN